MKKADLLLRPDEPVATGIIRIAVSLIESVLRRITHPSGDRGEDVHEIRTAIKRLRAIVRLIRPVTNATFFQRENTRLKTASHRLASSRDMAVARQTLTRLSRSAAGKREPDTFALVFDRCDRLVKRRPTTDLERAMEQVARALEQTRKNIRQLRIVADGWAAIGPGLERVYRESRRRMKTALADGDDGAFHRWRIRVKNLYYELHLIAPVWPEQLDPMIRRLKKLQDKIGSDHDLVVLKAMLEENPTAFGGPRVVKRVIHCLNVRSRSLRRASEPLGEAVFDEKPADFVGKMDRHWNIWRNRT